MDIPKIKHLDSNTEIDEYYEGIIKKIDTLVADDKYADALKIIDEELSQPYIPLKFYDLFHEYKYNITNIINDQDLEARYWTKTPLQLLEIIKNSHSFIPEYWEVFLDKIEIEDKSVEDYLEPINEIFLSTKLNNTDKFYLISTMIELGVVATFDFRNSHLNHLCKINTTTIESELQNSIYQQTLNQIYNFYFKDITKYNFAKDILYLVQDYYFPTFPFQNETTLFNAIKNYVEKVMFGSGDEKWFEDKEDELVYQAVKTVCQ